MAQWLVIWLQFQLKSISTLNCFLIKSIESIKSQLNIERKESNKTKKSDHYHHQWADHTPSATHFNINRYGAEIMKFNTTVLMDAIQCVPNWTMFTLLGVVCPKIYFDASSHSFMSRICGLEEIFHLVMTIVFPFSLRRTKIHSEESSMADVMRWYNTVNAALLDHLTNQIKETDNSGVWRYCLLIHITIIYCLSYRWAIIVIISADIWLVSRIFCEALNATVLHRCMASITLDAVYWARISTLITFATIYLARIY